MRFPIRFRAFAAALIVAFACVCLPSAINADYGTISFQVLKGGGSSVPPVAEVRCFFMDGPTRLRSAA